VSSHFLKPASRGTVPSTLKPEDLTKSIYKVSGHRSPYLQIRVVVVSSREEPYPKNHHNMTMLTEDICAMAKHTVNEEGQRFIKQKSDNYKSPLNYYPKSAKNPLPRRCSPSSAWRKRRIDLVPEKPALEVDGAHPSRLSGIDTGKEGGIEEADGEVLLPIMVGKEDEPALVRTIIEEEL
jgi:hypothetical protein